MEKGYITQVYLKTIAYFFRFYLAFLYYMQIYRRIIKCSTDKVSFSALCPATPSLKAQPVCFLVQSYSYSRSMRCNILK